MRVKKIHILFAALLFALCAIIVSVNKDITASADEHSNEYIGFNKTPEDFDDDTVFKDEYDTFLEAYYTNLTNNIGQNYKGSCGYVAIGMLLSYYATYLSDSIIPEKYICRSADNSINMNKRHNSPGIYADEIDKSSELSNDEYYEIIKKKAVSSYHPSLHAKLLTIGYEKGYYGKLSSSHPGGTTYDMVINILKDYLSERSFVENTNYTLTTKGSYLFESSNIRNFVIENIQAGKPVLIGIRHGLDFERAHYCIAYDYDEAADEVYANFGWGTKHQHTRVSNAYTDYFFALAIDFNMEHTHTKNYVVYNDGITNYYCWDNCDIITYKQKEHQYTNNYKDNGLNHTAYCACGASKVENHEYTNKYESINGLNHRAYCACGNKTTESHSWKTYYKPTMKGQYLECTYCHFLKKLGDDERIPIIYGKRDDEYEES